MILSFAAWSRCIFSFLKLSNFCWFVGSSMITERLDLLPDLFVSRTVYGCTFILLNYSYGTSYPIWDVSPNFEVIPRKVYGFVVKSECPSKSCSRRVGGLVTYADLLASAFNYCYMYEIRPVALYYSFGLSTLENAPFGEIEVFVKCLLPLSGRLEGLKCASSGHELWSMKFIPIPFKFSK